MGHVHLCGLLVMLKEAQMRMSSGTEVTQAMNFEFEVDIAANSMRTAT